MMLERARASFHFHSELRPPAAFVSSPASEDTKHLPSRHMETRLRDDSPLPLIVSSEAKLSSAFGGAQLSLAALGTSSSFSADNENIPIEGAAFPNDKCVDVLVVTSSLRSAHKAEYLHGTSACKFIVQSFV